MRHSVTTPLYRLRKAFDGVLSRWTPFAPFPALLPQLSQDTFGPTPRGWLALYTMVTFRPDVRYSEVRRKAERQDRILNLSVWTGLMATMGAGTFILGFWAWRLRA
jgi:kynurenine 3-monooxygenase